MAWRRGPTGVEEQGMCAVGFPQEPGRACRLRAVTGTRGSRLKQSPWPAVAALGRRRERRTKRKERYRQAKDNEARRDGRQAVGTPRITEEAGELTRRTRSREGGVGLRTV